MADRPTIGEMLATSAADIGAINGPSARAELLIAVAHETRDRDVWGGDRAITYWDRLPEKIRSACYRGPTLAAWWEAVTRTLGCAQPRRAEDRRALAACLSAGDDQAVLRQLREHTEMLCLRVRLAVNAARDAAKAAREAEDPEPTEIPGQEAML